MKHRTGLDRSQTLLLPERLEDYIAPENPVRFLDAFVADLDLAGLGFAKTRPADTGRPPATVGNGLWRCWTGRNRPSNSRRPSRRQNVRSVTGR